MLEKVTSLCTPDTNKRFALPVSNNSKPTISRPEPPVGTTMASVTILVFSTLCGRDIAYITRPIDQSIITAKILPDIN